MMQDDQVPAAATTSYPQCDLAILHCDTNQSHGKYKVHRSRCCLPVAVVHFLMCTILSTANTFLSPRKKQSLHDSTNPDSCGPLGTCLWGVG